MQNSKSVDSSSERYKYDVFLSFRGKDTRKTFIDHLYAALRNEGLITFRDDEGMKRGETISSELEYAIQQSKSWIIVISKNYACSRWCLDELVMILECRNNSTRLLLPIFYYVNPSDIRKQSGCIAEALHMHEEEIKREVDDTKRKDLMEKIKQWRTALSQVADLTGKTFPDETNGYEHRFIENIVNCVKDEVACNIQSITPHLVGIDNSARYINSWIRDGSRDVDVFALYGINGVGKTTIAKYVYNMNLHLFEGGSFLENVREYSERSDGLVCLQRQLLSDITKGKTPIINNLNDGLGKIRNAVNRKLLIVLDDVDQVEQLDAIFRMREWFHPGSKIILTTRDVDMIKARQPCKRYAVETLNAEDSLELFSLHAFRDSRPLECYIEHSDKILKQCQGLPLALVVLGASLRNKSMDIWRSIINKLEVLPHFKIHKVLQISYESLKDDHDRDLFLEIACFFTGEALSLVVGILSECQYHTRTGIKNLIDRGLLTIEFGKLRMHRLIQSMGREIIRQQSPRDPGQRSRVWHYKDSLKVLSDETGTRAIEGLALEVNMANVRQVELRTEAFFMMHGLRVLKLDNVWLSGSYKGFPKNLKWLSWCRYPLKALPNGFPLSSLVAIDMQSSKLQELGKGSMLLKSLKFLNLSHSHDLVKLPNFAELHALEQLILEGCVSLVEIDESIGMAQGLVLLDLKYCKLLKRLPKNICMLKCLEVLNISGCSNLGMLPAEMRKMEALKVFHADDIDFGRNSWDITLENESWLDLIWGWVSKSRIDPEISLISIPYNSITTLSLANCNLHENAFPKDLCFTSTLEYLDLSQNPIRFLPDCFKGLKRLRQLNLMQCNQLEVLEDLPSFIACIGLQQCPLLRTITFVKSRPFYISLASNKQLLEMADSMIEIVPIGEIHLEFINDCGIYDGEVKKRILINLHNTYTNTTTRCSIEVIGGSYFFNWFDDNFHNRLSDAQTHLHQKLICLEEEVKLIEEILAKKEEMNREELIQELIAMEAENNSLKKQLQRKRKLHLCLLVAVVMLCLHWY